jgi:hypothetical protein
MEPGGSRWLQPGIRTSLSADGASKADTKRGWWRSDGRWQSRSSYEMPDHPLRVMTVRLADGKVKQEASQAATIWDRSWQRVEAQPERGDHGYD